MISVPQSYDEGIDELHQFLMCRLDLTMRRAGSEDNRRLQRVYDAVLRTFTTAVTFERELKGYADGRQRQQGEGRPASLVSRWV